MRLQRRRSDMDARVKRGSVLDARNRLLVSVWPGDSFKAIGVRAAGEVANATIDHSDIRGLDTAWS
jgi:hypothetical protein